MPIDPVSPPLEVVLQDALAARFVLSREVARGGFAVVFEATSVMGGERVAIKALPIGLAGLDAAERFRRESQTLSTLTHRNIVGVLDAGVTDRITWFAMPLLEGEPLDRILARGRVPVTKAISILVQVASALDYLHSKGLVHRDIKPASVIVGVDGTATLVDLGLSFSVLDHPITHEGLIVGTPNYMAPEQWRGEPVTGAADRYSLAVMALEMLSGDAPFTGESVMDSAATHAGASRPRLSSRLRLPATVDGVLARGFAAQPADRFPSASAFTDALRRAILSQPVGVTLNQVLAADGGQRATLQDSLGLLGESAARESKRARRLLVLVALALTVAAPATLFSVMTLDPIHSVLLPNGLDAATLPAVALGLTVFGFSFLLIRRIWRRKQYYDLLVQVANGRLGVLKEIEDLRSTVSAPVAR